MYLYVWMRMSWFHGSHCSVLFQIFALHVLLALNDPLVVGLTKYFASSIRTTLHLQLASRTAIAIRAENKNQLSSRSALVAISEQKYNFAHYIRIISEEAMETNSTFVRERRSLFERRAGSLFRKAVACCTGYEEYDDLDEKARPVLQIVSSS